MLAQLSGEQLRLREAVAGVELVVRSSGGKVAELAAALDRFQSAEREARRLAQARTADDVNHAVADAKAELQNAVRERRRRMMMLVMMMMMMMMMTRCCTFCPG